MKGSRACNLPGQARKTDRANKDLSGVSHSRPIFAVVDASPRRQDARYQPFTCPSGCTEQCKALSPDSDSDALTMFVWMVRDLIEDYRGILTASLQWKGESIGLSPVFYRFSNIDCPVHLIWQQRAPVPVPAATLTSVGKDTFSGTSTGTGSPRATSSPTGGHVGRSKQVTPTRTVTRSPQSASPHTKPFLLIPGSRSSIVVLICHTLAVSTVLSGHAAHLQVRHASRMRVSKGTVLRMSSNGGHLFMSVKTRVTS